jgi:dimethylhistidine N-methyltransferase
MNHGSAAEPVLHDESPEREQFLAEALTGLSRPQKQLPCKYFYDECGSRLFERICGLDEYYPTRVELAIMRSHAAAMADAVGPRALLVEYGSGSSAKTRVLLDHLARPVAYVPVDISRASLVAAASALAARHPEIEVLPVCADFTRDFALPRPARRPARTVAYFPGSTIGNFAPARAVALLGGIAARCKSGGGLLIGVDLKKDPAVLERAYDDAAGVTAAFNLNVLARMNRELGADFDLRRFSHRAPWVPEEGRIEMHLVSEVDQVVRLGGRAIRFRAGESICTEYSHKYDLPEFAALADAAGFDVVRVWTDPERLFSVQYLEAR